MWSMEEINNHAVANMKLTPSEIAKNASKILKSGNKIGAYNLYAVASVIAFKKMNNMLSNRYAQKAIEISKAL